jgi:hypothetical protein
MTQKILFSILLALLFAAHASFAARTVPIGTPLQPIPQNTAPSYSQSVNSDASTFSASQKLEQKQLEPPAPAPNADQPNPANPPLPSPVVLASSEPILLYWILLIAGSLGLIGVLAWLYYRFRR